MLFCPALAAQPMERATTTDAAAVVTPCSSSLLCHRPVRTLCCLSSRARPLCMYRYLAFDHDDVNVMDRFGLMHKVGLMGLTANSFVGAESYRRAATGGTIHALEIGANCTRAAATVL